MSSTIYFIRKIITDTQGLFSNIHYLKSTEDISEQSSPATEDISEPGNPATEDVGDSASTATAGTETEPESEPETEPLLQYMEYGEIEY